MSRKSNGKQLVEYILRYSLKEKYNQIKSDATVILRNHIRSTKVEDIVKEFNLNEYYRIYRRADNVKVFHDVISFAKENKGMITMDMFKDFAEKYVELRAKNTLCIIVHHAEKEHDHLHAVTAGVKLDGYSSRISKAQLRHIKIELDKFQHEKYPQLDASLVNYKSVQSKQKIIEAIVNSRQTHKQSLFAILQKTFDASKSKDDFINRLEEQHCKPYLRNEKLQGVVIDGMKYRFSRFGFDEMKFKQLDQRQGEHELLEEMQSLRGGKRQNLEKNASKPKDELEELEMIRTSQLRSQSSERMIDIDGCDLPNVSSIPDIKTNRYLEDLSVSETDLEIEE